MAIALPMSHSVGCLMYERKVGLIDEGEEGRCTAIRVGTLSSG